MEGGHLLPVELVMDILVELPVKSIFRFKSVCKIWQSLIVRPSFIHRYSRISISRRSGKILCFRQDPIAKTHVISLVDHQTTKKIIDLEWPPFLDEGIHNKEEFHRDINVLGPVNGIYCIFNRLYEKSIGSLVLWNPATREYRQITPPVKFPFSFDFFSGKWFSHWYYESKRPIGLDIGFGLDSMTNSLQVVVISNWKAFYGDHDDRWHVRVYNLSTDSWRTIYYLNFKDDVLPLFEGLDPHFPSIASYPQFAHCHLNGVFHWSSHWCCIEGILAFDFGNETFQLIKGPTLPFFYYPIRSVWVLNETLAMVISIDDPEGNPTYADVWLMMEYGVDDSWAKLYSFGPVPSLSIVGIPCDERIFFHNDKGQLISFNFEDKGLKEYDVYGIPELLFHLYIYESLGVLNYVETIIPIKPMQQHL